LTLPVCQDLLTDPYVVFKNHLKKAFEIDLNWRMAALEDEDLKLLWDSL